MLWLLLTLVVLAVLALALYHLWVRRMLAGLDAILDRATMGDFQAEHYTESQVSKVEAKLARYLSSANRARGALEKDKNAVHELVSDISHQTKTPVANILLHVQLLDEAPELSQASRKLVRQIERGAEKLSFLIQSLIKASRLESGIVQVKISQGGLYELALAGAEDCRPKAAAKQVTLTVEKPAQEIRALYDPKWCAEAVYNVIDNAIKYTPPKGRVTVSLHDTELFACIRVADTGSGISEAELPKIFRRFYRSAAAAEEDGVGIGLYLAREIVQQCGGYMHATAAPGAGSVFSIYLSKL